MSSDGYDFEELDSAVFEAMDQIEAAHLADTQPREVWPIMQSTTERLYGITKNVEADWLRTPFACLINEEDLG